MENESLIVDLVSWVSKRPRSYVDVMDAWQTSCPRLTIWEDALDNKFLQRTLSDDHTAMVTVTEKGMEFVETAERVRSIC